MTQLLENDEDEGPPPSDGLSLVGETKAFLKRWQRLMLAGTDWDAEQVIALRQQSRDLESRARAADVSGLAHHLQTCEHCFWNGQIDTAKLANCLRNVSEVAWQWRQDLRVRSELYSVEGQGHVSHDRLIVEPPTLLTPPSVDMFESTPPPPDAPAARHDPSSEPEPEEEEAAVDPFRKPSLWKRLFGSRKGSPESGASPQRRVKRRSPVSFPSLADAVYEEATPAAAPVIGYGDIELPSEGSPAVLDAELAPRVAPAPVDPVAAAPPAQLTPEAAPVASPQPAAGPEVAQGQPAVEAAAAIEVSPTPPAQVEAPAPVQVEAAAPAQVEAAAPAPLVTAPEAAAAPPLRAPPPYPPLGIAAPVAVRRPAESRNEAESPGSRPLGPPRPRGSAATPLLGGTPPAPLAAPVRVEASPIRAETVTGAIVAHGQIELRGDVATAVPAAAPPPPSGVEGDGASSGPEGVNEPDSSAVAASSEVESSATAASSEVESSTVATSNEVHEDPGVAADGGGESSLGAAGAGESVGADDVTPKGLPEVRVRDVATKPGLPVHREVTARGEVAARNELAASAGDVTPLGLPELRVRDVTTKPGFGANPLASPGEAESGGPRMATPPPPPDVWNGDGGQDLGVLARSPVEYRGAVESPRPRSATPPPLPPELVRGDVTASRGAESRGELASNPGLSALRDEALAAPSRRSARSWWGASLGVLCVGGVLIWALRETERDRTVAPLAATGPVGTSEVARAPAPPVLGRQAIDTLAASAHGYGGIESPELAELLDEEAATLAEGGGACAPGAAGCELVSTAHGLSTAPGVANPSERQAEQGSWLEGLAAPGIGIKDDARVRRFFEFHTRNSVGRETFQELLFRCAPYREMIEASLTRYGVAPELLAVAMATSGCVIDAESAEAGRGLWQLTPAEAKAYHLRLKDQVVDERLDTVRSTDAGVRLLEDLYRKTGSWELAISAFRVGPLPLLARLGSFGDGASYWALVDSGGLSGEAAAIVPKVQAFALILANLEKFRFEPAPLRATEATALLDVPPGTRLGLVARAAGSSTTKIRELNPDMIGDRVPDWPGEKFSLRVPKDASERARDALPELIVSADHADECVPHAFDWGRQRFTTAMASRCEHASAMNH